MTRAEKLTKLFQETEAAHQSAHGHAMADDPDWSIWFADHINPALEREFDIRLSKAELIKCLMEAETEHRARFADQDWANSFAAHLLDRCGPSQTGDKLALYYYETCPFCQLVLGKIDELGIEVEYRHVKKTPSHREDLVRARGRGTVPVLRIMSADGTDRWMPESRDIVRYLQQTYG